MLLGNSYVHKHKCFFLFSLISIFAIQFTFGQGTGSLKGQVVDKETGDPLPGANILVANTSIGSVSDLDGKFVVRNIPAGVQKIRVSYLGYVTIIQNVTITSDEEVNLNIQMTAHALEGEAVIVTAQARGQKAAINQQISSNTIANVVSEARIKELPDVNAAESIGRLPGISLERYNGEATGVDIRGLSPKYNAVTVNGVDLPATGSGDRSVDLSLISSNMLQGIEVKKANTPDMDAYVLGGTVDLQLREAPEGGEFSASAQGGYNQLEKYYGNYNFNITGGNRFFDNDLGIIASINLDKYNRGSDKLSGSYGTGQPDPTNQPDYYKVYPTNVQLNSESLTRKRTGASTFIDYRIPNGKITSSFFYNQLGSDYVLRRNRMDKEHSSHYYDLEQSNDQKTSVFTGSVGIKQDFNWVQVDLSLARTGTRSDTPDDRQWTFAQENNAFNAPKYATVFEIPNYQILDTNGTAFSSAYIFKRLSQEHQSTAQLNIKIPYHVTEDLTGYLKLGGKFRHLNRMYNQDQSGRDGLQYGSSTGLSQPLTVLLKSLAQKYPAQWNFERDSALVRQRGWFPITPILSNYDRSNFLGGQFHLGMNPDLGVMNQLTDAFKETAEWLPYSIGSLGSDYDGIEEYEAGYVMTEFNIGKEITVIPGVRWEQSYSKYNGERFREATVNNTQGAPTDLVYLTKYRRYHYWLPALHLIIAPLDWLKIRLASTETLTQPDYNMYAPITSINVYQNYVRAANSDLKPAHSKNYDASISVYDDYVGLFSVSGFQKTIYDLILQTSILGVKTDSVLPAGVNVNPNWWLGGAAISPQVDTYINNPYPAKYKGFELEWQTHFWYLPSVLQGLVLNINFTKIYSTMDTKYFSVKTDSLHPYTIPGSRFPHYPSYRSDTTRSSRLTGQPDHIVNLSFGYDYKGFSIRASYLYQTDKITFIALKAITDQTTGPYARWDLAVQQKLDWGIQLFANFNNLNNRHDANYVGDALVDPSYLEYYGFTSDVGIRINL